MKIVAYLDVEIGAGGGFNQALNAVLRASHLCKNDFEFEVFVVSEKSSQYLHGLGISSKIVRPSLFDKLMLKAFRSEFLKNFYKRFKIQSRFEQALIQSNCDLVYFVTPTNMGSVLQNLNYVYTIWDLSHRDTPEFPEVRDFRLIDERDLNVRLNINPAYLVLTDSQELSNSLFSRYGVDPDRCLAMPFSPSPLVNLEKLTTDIHARLEIEGDYFYYPAQFWAHKNHVGLLKAIKHLNMEGWYPPLVLSGRDMGNLNHIKNLVKKLNIESQVVFVGFVTPEELSDLYLGAKAIIMPTYFGWTNLPPLEAWAYRKPLIYSEQFVGQVGSAAILVNPDSSVSIAEGMKKTLSPDIVDDLIIEGDNRLKYFNEKREEAEMQFLEKLKLFSIRRDCWPK